MNDLDVTIDLEELPAFTHQCVGCGVELDDADASLCPDCEAFCAAYFQRSEQ